MCAERKADRTARNSFGSGGWRDRGVKGAEQGASLFVAGLMWDKVSRVDSRPWNVASWLLAFWTIF